VQRFDELRAAAEQVTGETAPELELAVDLERLPAESGWKRMPCFLSHSAAA
jgi:hypothetical protein